MFPKECIILYCLLPYACVATGQIQITVVGILSESDTMHVFRMSWITKNYGYNVVADLKKGTNITYIPWFMLNPLQRKDLSPRKNSGKNVN